MKNNFNIGDLVRKSGCTHPYGIIVERGRVHGASSFRIHWAGEETSWESRLWLQLVARVQ